MTDKPIIIDDVDVSGCRCLAYPEADNPMCTGLYLGCKNNNCEYKNWKRKEQECEELKEKVKKYGEINEQETKDYAELKAENEKLKNFHINLVGVKECEIKELVKLKQTLTEIKEIAEANKKYIYVLPSYFVAGDSLEFSFEFIKNILNKISECEVE